MTGQHPLAIVTVAGGVLHLVWGPFGVHFVRSSVGAHFSRGRALGGFAAAGSGGGELAGLFWRGHIFVGTSAGGDLTSPPVRWCGEARGIFVECSEPSTSVVSAGLGLCAIDQ